MSTPTHQISSSAVHIITGKLGDDPVQWATHSNAPMTVFSVKVVCCPLPSLSPYHAPPECAWCQQARLLTDMPVITSLVEQYGVPVGLCLRCTLDEIERLAPNHDDSDAASFAGNRQSSAA